MNPPPTSLPTTSLWVIPMHQPQASCTLRQTWTGNSIPRNLDSSLCFFQSSVSHDVLCTEVKWAGWQYTALMYSFSDLEPVHFSMFGSNCCFLACIQISQESGKVGLYSYLLKNFPQFVLIYTIIGCSVVIEAEACFSGFLWGGLTKTFITVCFLYKKKQKQGAIDTKGTFHAKSAQQRTEMVWT